MLTGPRFALVRNSRAAQATANPKRAKYSRRSADAVSVPVDEATVATVVLSTKGKRSVEETERSTSFRVAGRSRIVKTERSIR
jgi:hypothetical protein